MGTRREGKRKTFPSQQIGGSVTLNHAGGGGEEKGKVGGRQRKGWCERQEGQRGAEHITLAEGNTKSCSSFSISVLCWHAAVSMACWVVSLQTS